MSNTNFNPQDWIYVADSMGRLGQGYYKNRMNSGQTITAAEFERRRTQAPVQQKKNDEQIINIKPASTPASIEASSLTPWDNPLKGEENLKAQGNQSQAGRKKPLPTAKKPVTAAVEPEKPKREDGEGGTTGNSFESNGESGEAKVICTEMVAQGLMTEKARRACTLYAYSRLPTRFMNGYHFWAVPYVRLMRRSRLATCLIVGFVNYRTQEIQHRLSPKTHKSSLLGKIICTLHDPLCSFVGRFVTPPSYQGLYVGKSCV